MREKTVELGRVVRSIAGRDNGGHFIIVKVVSDDYVLIADGDKRRLNSPKKKKIKHLHFLPDVFEQIGKKFEENKKVFDAEVVSALKSLSAKNLYEKGDLELV